MTKETEVIGPVLKVLAQAPNGRLKTCEVRELVRERIKLTADDLLPLRNRNDQRIDQIIRNLKSHKDVPGNPFAEGLLRDVPRGFEITAAGRRAIGS